MTRYYSFLTESKSKLLKRLSRYTPEEISKIRERMISLGKQNGGWYSPEEYGERMIKGQIKRIKKIDPNGQVNLTDCPLFKSNTTATVNKNGNLVVDMSLPRHSSNFEKPPVGGFYDPKLNKKDLKQFIKSDEYFRKNPEASKTLTIADVYGHEADELLLSLKNAVKWNEKHPDKRLSLYQFIDQVGRATKDTEGRHQKGVLEREAKRRHLLSQLYGRDSMFHLTRTPKSYALNKKGFTVDDYNRTVNWD